MKETLAIIAGILAVVGNIPYVRDVFRGRIEPHPYTWFVASVVSGIIFFGQVAKGAGMGALPTLVSELFTIVIFVLSLRFGLKHVRASDIYFLVFALLGLVPWYITKDATVSVVCAVLIDIVGIAPAMRKTWNNPTTERPFLYGTNVIRHVLALGALETYNVATMLHSLVMLVTNSLMTSIILFKKKTLYS